MFGFLLETIITTAEVVAEPVISIAEVVVPVVEPIVTGTTNTIIDIAEEIIPEE